MTTLGIITTVVALLIGIGIGWVYHESGHEIPGTEHHKRS